jgi:hypothetical protein
MYHLSLLELGWAELQETIVKSRIAEGLGFSVLCCALVDCGVLFQKGSGLGLGPAKDGKRVECNSEEDYGYKDNLIF